MTGRRTPVETIGLLAIVQHAAEHGLPVHGIDIPITRGEPFVIKLAARDLEGWLNTLDDLGPAVTKPISDTGSESLRHTGKVPTAVGSVRVETLTVVSRPTGLRLVGGAAS